MQIRTFILTLLSIIDSSVGVVANVSQTPVVVTPPISRYPLNTTDTSLWGVEIQRQSARDSSQLQDQLLVTEGVQHPNGVRTFHEILTGSQGSQRLQASMGSYVRSAI